MSRDESWGVFTGGQPAEDQGEREKPFKAVVFPEFYVGPFSELKMFIRRPTKQGVGILISVSSVLGGLSDPSEVIIYRGTKYLVTVGNSAPEYDDNEGIYSAVQVVPEKCQDAMAVAMMVYGNLHPLPEHRADVDCAPDGSADAAG